MNSLVDYGPDSDEETSPRRRLSMEANPLRGSHSQPAAASVSPTSSQSRSRKDSDFFYDEEMADNDEAADSQDDGNTEDGFREPAPPRGHADSEDSDSPEIQCRIVKVSSTASLSAFERDTFEKEDARAEAAGDDHSRDMSAEPAPPIRQSMDEDDEEEIDRQLEECKDLMTVGGSEGGSTPATPYNDSPREMEGPATPRAVEEAKVVVLPPAPDVPCDPAVEARFALMFERKGRGENYNNVFQSNKNFLNPSIYELFIEKHEIKEFGSNFPVERYDPDGYPPETYYDVIAKRQNDAVSKANAAAAKKAVDHSAAKKPKL